MVCLKRQSYSSSWHQNIGHSRNLDDDQNVCHLLLNLERWPWELHLSAVDSLLCSLNIPVLLNLWTTAQIE